MVSPDYICDFSLEDQKRGIVCGLDEVGRGPLAGPVVAACVYIPPESRGLEFINHIKDSKKLTDKKRTLLFNDIQNHCVIGIGECSPTEIDDLNILWASMEAMMRALVDMQAKSGLTASHLLIDGNRLPKATPCPAEAIVKGDARSKSIAAASIIAKVTRDEHMKKIALEHPYYGWENNSAYPSPQHLEAIKTHGITPHHRKSFKPVQDYLEANMPAQKHS